MFQNIAFFYTRHALLSDAPVFYVCLHLNFIRLQHYLDMNRVIFLYDMTPSEFRAREKEKKQAGQAGALGAKIAKKAEDYLKNSAPEQALSRQYLIADAHNQKIYSKYWKRMININRMSDLFQSDIQSHILLLKHELDFEYIRLRDIYSEELELNIGGNGDYYFEKMDRVMDFLIHHGIHPYIEIGVKPEMLVERLDQYLVAEHKEILFKTYAEAKYFFHSMISHYANRYGIAEIELWYFELWKDPRLLKKHDYQDYFTAFEACYDAIKEISPNIRIGGGSIHMTFDEPIFAEFLSHWKQRIVNPDFLSIYSYPYYTGSAGRAIDRRRSQDTGYLKKTVETITDKLARIGFHVKEIHVSEWNGSVSNRNPMNDSIWQGAYVMKNIIDNLGGISLLGYWLGSDLFSRHNYTNDILNGKSRQPPAALRQRLWPLAGGRHLVIPPGPGALADPLDDLLAVQSQAQRPGHLRGADTSEIMGKSVGAQYRNRFKGTGAVHLHVTAEFGRAGHRKVTCHTPTNHHADWSGGCT